MWPVSSKSRGLLPRTLVLLFIAAGVFIALMDRSGVFQQSGAAEHGAAAQPPSASSAGLAITAHDPPAPPPTPLPTATPLPTPTPIPVPVKFRNGAPPEVGAVSAVVVDELSGAVLYSKNAHLERAPASITKIVTAIVALERGKLDDLITVRYDPDELIDSTVMGVNPGDRCTLEDLLYGLMLPSGNDAALAVANYVAGSNEAFAKLMNAKMAELGLQDSHFVNPHGLDANGHYSSAYDMAMVSRYAMQNPTFRKLAAARLHAVTVQTPNGAKRYDVFNLNRLVGTYRGADGVKIGYTDNALRTIVGSATRDAHRVYVALMGSSNLWTDSPPLLDYAFQNFSWPGQPPR